MIIDCYERAQEKLSVAEHTSNLETESEYCKEVENLSKIKKKKQMKRKKINYSSDSEVETIVSNKSKKKLPLPPLIVPNSSSGHISLNEDHEGQLHSTSNHSIQSNHPTIQLNKIIGSQPVCLPNSQPSFVDEVMQPEQHWFSTPQIHTPQESASAVQASGKYSRCFINLLLVCIIQCIYSYYVYVSPSILNVCK